MVNVITWLRCNKCGWERASCAMVNQCPECGTFESLHVISNRDGEMPKRLSLEDLSTYAAPALPKSARNDTPVAVQRVVMSWFLPQ